MKKNLRYPIPGVSASPVARPESGWEDVTTMYGGFTAIGSAVGTPGSVEKTKVDFSDVPDAMDKALIGTFEVRHRHSRPVDFVLRGCSSPGISLFGDRWANPVAAARLTSRQIGIAGT